MQYVGQDHRYRIVADYIAEKQGGAGIGKRTKASCQTKIERDPGIDKFNAKSVDKG